jgi:16S rRNA C1402 (ribose-2'-O) methylase RsmI
MEMRPASTNGSAAPAAKGMTVRGTSAMETALFAVSYTIPLHVVLFHGFLSHLSKLQW